LPLEVNADPFLMAVAVAAPCTFLTPIGQKNNTLILGAGGCRFGDYWRMGPPLEVSIVLVGIPMILLVWPFRGGRPCGQSGPYLSLSSLAGSNWP
jgi:di/tricarboxylate transporter